MRSRADLPPTFFTVEDSPLSLSAAPAASGIFMFLKSACILFQPRATWDWRPRILSRPAETTRPHERNVATLTWVSIPDANLPGAWTCNWACWPYWENELPLEATLAERYALSDEPLAPVMFETLYDSTVFACPATRKFYLYSRRCGWTEREEEIVYAFDGVFPSVEAFIEEADWNHMEQVLPRTGEDTMTAGLRSASNAKLPLIGERGFRVAAEEPYRIYSPSVQGTFMYVPRIHEGYYRRLDEDSPAHGWQHIPDVQLPEPWSCKWNEYIATNDWCWGNNIQETAELAYGRDLRAIVPALFVPHDPWRGDTVVCPPGGAGTYYLWWHENRRDNGEWGPFTGSMQRFQGVYASLEHFIRTADWNKLEGVPYIVRTSSALALCFLTSGAQDERRPRTSALETRRSEFYLRSTGRSRNLRRWGQRLCPRFTQRGNRGQQSHRRHSAKAKQTQRAVGREW
ncbi:hypothetical protein FB451DRAFT_1186018 [Mycena latifolia]|nr:hypothetical protein FB451DRAFT_1186018 [Mycena latifolia]